MAKSKKQNTICEECGGKGFTTNPVEECFNCLGSGYASDDDNFEHVYKYENDWRN